MEMNMKDHYINLKNMEKDYTNLKKVVILKEHFIKIILHMVNLFIEMDKNILEVWEIWSVMDLDNITIQMVL